MDPPCPDHKFVKVERERELGSTCDLYRCANCDVQLLCTSPEWIQKMQEKHRRTRDLLDIMRRHSAVGLQ